MPSDSAKHHRRSIRLVGYDYSQCGAYFVTICTRKDGAAAPLAEAGNLDSADRFVLTEIGKIVEQNWLDLCSRFSQVSLDEYVIMPNHLHGIIVIRDEEARAGAKVAPALGAIVGAFKSKSVTDILVHIAANHLEMVGKIWQRNYFERIIRSERELDLVRAYIRNNPQKWAEDREQHPVTPH